MHLVTHGFFKAGLFLGAGSVMHGMNDEVDMRRYGGLRKYMPVTFVTFGLGYLAIIGFPGLSGFFSKDKIIEAAFAKGGTEGWILGGAALLGAAITAFYMTRVMLMTFFGEKRWQPDARRAYEPHPHESPRSMTIPMIVLAFGSVFAGRLLSHRRPLPALAGARHRARTRATPVAAGVGITAVTLAVVAHRRRASPTACTGARRSPRSRPRGSLLTRAARRDLYRTTSTTCVLVRPGGAPHPLPGLRRPHPVDGVVNGTAASSAASPGGCAGCRTASRGRTRSRCSAVRRCSSRRSC